jgi:jumonji domain-containing protein 2
LHAGLQRKYAAISDGSLDFSLETPVVQNAIGRQGVFKHYHVVKPSINLQAYKAVAEQPDNLAPKFQDRARGDAEDKARLLEKRFWSALGTQAMRPPLYAADIPGRSLFDDEARPWDMRDLDTLLQRSIAPVEGVTRATLFVGMWRTCFAWHTEDYDLSALNFLHLGADKIWYGVPAASKGRFEAMCAQLFPGQVDKCPAFLRHKQFMVSPHVAKDYGIPMFKAVQRPGELVMTMPGAFHCGFNSGFNVAEAANFALSSWIPRGLASRQCLCRPGAVTIDMRIFKTGGSGCRPADAPRDAEGGLAEDQRLVCGQVEGACNPGEWLEDDIVWAQVPESPPWPGRVCQPATARQKRELAEKDRWVFVVFYGPREEWAVVPPCDVVCRFPGPPAVACKARALASRQVWPVSMRRPGVVCSVWEVVEQVLSVLSMLPCGRGRARCLPTRPAQRRRLNPKPQTLNPAAEACATVAQRPLPRSRPLVAQHDMPCGRVACAWA